ncbi:MAG: hypothetical protein LBM66_06175 [Bifidobacteriaceae bacterium]|jgi:hypothetical protein|nr:hypothetical protein [Bifidobacteriaceae bacterium]
MPVTLAEAKLNALEAYDPAVIDEFRKESTIADTLIFDQCVNPAGGGATWDYAYRRLATEATAATRQINADYQAQEVTTVKVATTLGIFGGKFQVDRALVTPPPDASEAGRRRRHGPGGRRSTHR